MASARSGGVRAASRSWRAGHTVEDGPAIPFRPWVLAILPGIGALLGGILTIWAPEARGGGGDATLHAFHQQGGVVRRRVIGIKALASIFTLGTGGAGGREGPTMQIGAAIGSLVGRYLRVTVRERRILLIAGVAGDVCGVSHTAGGRAVGRRGALSRRFRVRRPDSRASRERRGLLGLHFISRRVDPVRACAALPLRPGASPALRGAGHVLGALRQWFLSLLHWVQKKTASVPVPAWVRPGLGGLALGICVTPVVVLVGPYIGRAGQGLGIFGGGYGAAQVAITGADWLPLGWQGVELLLMAALVKVVATSLTVGSGGSAGDFGPSLVMGGSWEAPSDGLPRCYCTIRASILAPLLWSAWGPSTEESPTRRLAHWSWFVNWRGAMTFWFRSCWQKE